MNKDEIVELFCILALFTLAANLPIWDYQLLMGTNYV